MNRQSWLAMASGFAIVWSLTLCSVQGSDRLQPTRSPFAADPQNVTRSPLDRQWPEGALDYLMIANAAASKGVTPANNAAVVVVRLMAPQDWPSESLRNGTFAKLGIDLPGPEARYFVPFERFAQEHAIEGEADVWEEAWKQAQDGPWSADQLPRVTQWLEAQSPALDMLAKGVQRERYWLPWVREAEDAYLLEMRVPSLGFVRSMASGLTARAYQRLTASNVEGAIQDLLAMKRLAHRMKETPLAIDQLVGTSIGMMASDIFVTVLASKQLTPGQARHLQRELKITAGRFPVERGVDSERLMALEIVDRWPAEPVHELLFVTREAAPRSWSMQEPIISRYLDRQHARGRINDAHDQVVVALRHPGFAQRQDHLNQLDQHIEQRADAVSEIFLAPEGSVELLGADLTDAQRVARFTDTTSDFILNLLLPALGAAAADWAATRIGMVSELELLAVALAGYRAEHGQYPAALEALVPGWIEAIPIDRFATDDRAVRYRLEANRVVLYSVGHNGEDNDGKEASDPGDGDLLLHWRR